MSRGKGRKKVVFWATVKVPVRKKVSFKTKSGRRIVFSVTVKVPKKKKVTFYRKKKR